VRRVKDYLRELTTPPLPLSRGQRWLFGALFAVVAVSRRYALSKTPLDWDESLFACGVREYDVLAEHPHAPGYPLFILFGKLARLVVRDDFHALQTVASLASLLLFPAVVYLLRELRFRARVALIGAVITVFLPTVWYYGGTALSDVPALCGAVAASALLLAGARNPRAWVAGMFVAAVTAGIRPAHIVIAAIPALLGSTALRRKTIVAGCALFAAVVLARYSGAAFATQNPPWGYLSKFAEMTGHIRGTDSFQNVMRPPLPKLAAMFFVTVHRGGRAGLALLGLAALGLAEGAVRRRVNVAVVAAMFAPLAVASWLMLDISAVTRYGLAYVMLYSVAAACGIDALARVVRNAAIQHAIATAGAALLVLPLINWARPALSLARHRPSPPVEAMRWVRTNVPAVGPSLYLSDLLHFHAWYQLPGRDVHYFNSDDEIPASAFVAGNYYLTDGVTLQPHARLFRFPQTRLAQIARTAFFDISVVPMASMIHFGNGWYGDEYDAGHEHPWRWMQERSTMWLPPLGSDGVLHMVYHVPLDGLRHPPKLKIIWNGTVIEDGVCKDFDYDRRYVLRSRAGVQNECRIVLDEAATAANDLRHFGLQLWGISWERTDGLPYGF